MNVRDFKIELANELNYKFNQQLNIVYGKTEGYTSIIMPMDAYETAYNIVYCVSKDGSALNKEDFAVLKTENKIIANIRVDNYRVIFTIKGKMKQEDRKNDIIEGNKIIVNYLKENDYKNIDEHTKALSDTTICNVKGKPSFVTTETLETLKNESTNNSVEAEEKIPNGILGAFLGSLVGVLAIIIIGQLGYIAVISGIAMGACTILGYKKLAGSISKKGIVISILVMIIMTYIGIRLNASMTIHKELSKYGTCDFGEIFKTLPELVKLDSKVQSAYIQDMVMTYIFTILGAFGIIKAKVAEIGNSNVYEVL